MKAAIKSDLGGRWGCKKNWTKYVKAAINSGHQLRYRSCIQSWETFTFGLAFTSTGQ